MADPLRLRRVAVGAVLLATVSVTAAFTGIRTVPVEAALAVAEAPAAAEAPVVAALPRQTTELVAPGEMVPSASGAQVETVPDPQGDARRTGARPASGPGRRPVTVEGLADSAPAPQQAVEGLADSAPAQQAVEGLADSALAPQAVDGLADSAPAPQAVEGLADSAPAPQVVDGLADSAPSPQAVEGLADSAPAQQAVEGLADSAPASQAVEGLADSAPASQAVEGLADSAPASQAVEGLADSAPSPQAVEGLADSAPASQAVEGLADSAPAPQAVEGLADSAPASQAVEGLADSAPAPQVVDGSAGDAPAPRITQVSPVPAPAMDRAGGVRALHDPARVRLSAADHGGVARLVTATPAVPAAATGPVVASLPTAPATGTATASQPAAAATGPVVASLPTAPATGTATASQPAAPATGTVVASLPTAPVTGTATASQPAAPAGIGPADADDQPMWRRNALAVAPVTGDRPLIAIVIDDVGVNRRQARQVVGLPGPLTLSLMSYARDLPRLARTARRNGHELMLHLPMEPHGRNTDPGEQALLVHLEPGELRRRINWALDRFPGYVGVNNHMGSRFTESRAGMAIVMEEISKRGLLFLDSRTSGKSVALDVAIEHGVPAATRQVFVDHDMDVASMQDSLAHLERVARLRGYAIGIAHPHRSTLEVLEPWLESLGRRGFRLVPVSSIVARNRGAG